MTRACIAGRRAARRRVVLVLLGAVMLTVAAAPAGAAQPTSVVAELVGISPQVRGTDALRIELRAAGAMPTDQIRISIYTRETRAKVRAYIEGTDKPRTVGYNVITKRVSEATEPGRSSLVITVANDQLPLTPGVYPIQITVGSSAPVLSWLVRIGGAAAGEVPFTVSLVVPVRAPLGDQSDGTVRVDATDRARLDAVATFVESAPSGAVTVVPNPETLDALDASSPDARATLEHLQTASRTNLVLRAPFVPIDIDAWRRAGRDDHVALQLRTGLDATARSLGRAATDISTRTVIADRLTSPSSLESLRREGAVNVVVPETQLEPLRTDAFPSPFSQTFRVRDADGQDLLAASADAWLSRTVASVDTAAQPGAVAQQVLADVAAAFFDRPSLARGSVIVLPDNWSPTSTVIDDLLKPLAASSVVQLRNLDGYFATVARSAPDAEAKAETLVLGPLRRSLIVTRGPDMDAHAVRVDAARTALESYSSIFGLGSGSPVAMFDELLLASSDLRLDAAERERYVNATTEYVQRSLRAADGGVGIEVPASERITLTSRRETIRLVVVNRLLAPATVRIDLRSEKLAFPRGESITATLQPGSNTVEFDVSVKTSGDSLLEYTVNAPTGSLGELAKGKLRVRSIALSGLGLVLSIVAVLVIVVWWGRHGMRSRRTKRELVHVA